MSAVQWYPGHMVKARRLIAELVPTQDVLVEVLDARMPRASQNPVLAELRGTKPWVRVLGKSDLADPAATARWLSEMAASGEAHPIALSTSKPGEIRAKLPALCKSLAKKPRGVGGRPRVMIVGIPNVGKSTLVNTLMERKVANVGDEPAVTKSQQQAITKSGLVLSDNPGILWPKIDDEAAATRLALGGAIADAALDYESVALFGAGIFLERYPTLVQGRYKLAALPETPEALLDEVGRRRGCLKPGGVVDRHKAADVLVHDFRSGALGRITLELP